MKLTDDVVDTGHDMNTFTLTKSQLEEVVYRAEQLRVESGFETSGEAFYDGQNNGFIDGVRFVLEKLGIKYTINPDSFETGD